MSDMEQQRRLQILANPAETRTIECKSWLDLSDNKIKAKLAKAAIAMANSGGGTIALGISEDETNGKKLVCKPRPSNVARYNSDDVGSAINKYAEPELEPKLVFENHPDSGDEHAFVEIAGGMHQPVFAKRQLNGEIEKLACYIRKPSPPRSEVPHTAQEWRDLLQRCVLGSRDSLLGSIRTIIDGRLLDTSSSVSDEQNLIEFMAASEDRWRGRLGALEDDHVAHFRHGYWTAAFSILGAPPSSSHIELRRNIDEAKEGSRTDYGPFWEQYRHGPEAIPTNDGFEAWLANPVAKEYYDPRECCFWRATLDGQFYYLDAFYEDAGFLSMAPGHLYDISVSLKRYGQMFMFAGRIARMFGENAEVLMCSQLTGVMDRLLSSERLWWLKRRGFISKVATISFVPIRVTPQEIDDNLVEILLEFLHPVYVLFNLYDLERKLVAVEIDNLKSGIW
ncbi:MAG: putative DNA binding domain-containing protein [Chloroflexi bacterium]|nr:putative DNA binding domain-containing protein [Chloroflexota bacterium]